MRQSLLFSCHRCARARARTCARTQLHPVVRSIFNLFPAAPTRVFTSAFFEMEFLFPPLADANKLSFALRHSGPSEGDECPSFLSNRQSRKFNPRNTRILIALSFIGRTLGSSRVIARSAIRVRVNAGKKLVLLAHH